MRIFRSFATNFVFGTKDLRYLTSLHMIWGDGPDLKVVRNIIASNKPSYSTSYYPALKHRRILTCGNRMILSR